MSKKTNSDLATAVEAPQQSPPAATVHGFHDGYLIASTFGVAASLIAIFVIRAQTAKSDPSHGEAAAAL